MANLSLETDPVQQQDSEEVSESSGYLEPFARGGVVDPLVGEERLRLQRNQWTERKINQKIWLGIVDYGRVAWETVKKKTAKDPGQSAFLISQFKRRWCEHDIIGSLAADSSKVQWKLTGPVEDYSYSVY